MINPVPPVFCCPGNVETAPLDIRKLAGVLKDANGNALKGVTVYAYQRDTDELAGVTTTAADGSWSLSVNNTPSGYYVVWAVPTVLNSLGAMVGPYFTS